MEIGRCVRVSSVLDFRSPLVSKVVNILVLLEAVGGAVFLGA